MTNISQKLSFDVLVPFTQNYARKLHASKIAQLLKLPQKTVFRKLENLQKLGFLKYGRVGKNKYYFFDLDLIISQSLIEMIECYKELVFLRKNLKLALLFDELVKENSVVLFGSYAKGTAKEDSDIDLVIFGRKNKRIEVIIKRYPFEINVHYVSFVLFRKRLKEKQHLAREIAENHILFGEKEKVIKLLMNYFKR